MSVQLDVRVGHSGQNHLKERLHPFWTAQPNSPFFRPSQQYSNSRGMKRLLCLLKNSNLDCPFFYVLPFLVGLAIPLIAHAQAQAQAPAPAPAAAPAPAPPATAGPSPNSGPVTWADFVTSCQTAGQVALTYSEGPSEATM